MLKHVVMVNGDVLVIPCNSAVVIIHGIGDIAIGTIVVIVNMAVM